MKSFKELPSRIEIRVTLLNHGIGFRISNREDVGHRCTFLWCDPGALTNLGVSGDDLCPGIAAVLLPGLAALLRPLLVE